LRDKFLKEIKKISKVASGSGQEFAGHYNGDGIENYLNLLKQKTHRIKSKN